MVYKFNIPLSYINLVKFLTKKIYSTKPKFFLVFSETAQEKKFEANLGIHSNKDWRFKINNLSTMLYNKVEIYIKIVFGKILLNSSLYISFLIMVKLWPSKNNWKILNNYFCFDQNRGEFSKEKGNKILLKATLSRKIIRWDFTSKGKLRYGL